MRGRSALCLPFTPSGWFTATAIALVVALPVAALTLMVVMARRGG